MAGEVEALRAAVTAIQGEANSIITLVNGLAQYIRDHANDPASLQAFADDLTATGQAMAAAVAANPVP